MEQNKNNKQYCVYIHRNKTNNKSYIGITNNKPQYRWGKDGNGYKKNQDIFYNAICKYGWDNFEHIIWAEGLTKNEAEQWEVRLIAIFKTNCRRYRTPEYGYNMTDGGEGASGWGCSDEWRKKQSESHKGKFEGEHNPFYGKSHTKEAKDKMRQSHANVSGKNNPMYGKHMSENSKEKMRIAKKDIAKPVVQIDKDGNFIKKYSSISEANKSTGISHSSISKCCNLEDLTMLIAGGYQWMWQDDYKQFGGHKYKSPHLKPVIKINENNEIIAEYKSLSDASESAGVSISWMCQCCKNQNHTINGYRFMYKEICIR